MSMATSSKTTGNQWVWSKFIMLACLIAMCAGFAYITWWSFLQTKVWFSFLDFGGDNYVSLSLAVIFQYGQGPVLFLRSIFVIRKLQLEDKANRAQSDALRLSIIENEIDRTQWAIHGLSALFVVFASIDAWTNVKVMHSGLDSKGGRAVVGTDKYVFTSLIGIVVVFVEEMFGICFSLASHTLNDILEIFGRRRIGWLDVISDQAKSILSGDVGGQRSGGGSHKPFRPVSKQSTSFQSGGGGNRAQSVNRPMPTTTSEQSDFFKPVPSAASRPLYNEPTYHSVEGRSEGG